jgi:hypothetical protein
MNYYILNGSKPTFPELVSSAAPCVVISSFQTAMKRFVMSVPGSPLLLREGLGVRETLQAGMIGDEITV